MQFIVDFHILFCGKGLLSMLEQLRHVQLIRWYQTNSRRSFLLSEDTYSNWVILAADEGKFEYKIDDEKGMVQFGDIILCPPGVRLERRAIQPLSFLFIEFNWGAMKEEKQKLLATIPRGKVSFHHIDRYSTTYSLIREFSDMDIPDHWDHKQHLLQDLLYLYIIEHQHQKSATLLATKDPIVRNAVNHLQNHAFEPLSLQELADQAALSQSQFSRRFQASMGVTPIVFLTGIRMQKAQNLLLGSELNLEEIAQQCGYQNGFYLSRVFKKRYGVSPSQFRKTYRF